jgi:hypothetical protein
LQFGDYFLTLKTQSKYHKDVRIFNLKPMAVLADNKPFMPDNGNGLWHVLHPLLCHRSPFFNGGQLAWLPVFGASGLLRLFLHLIYLRR